ncbi:4-diphosphocytidyl-2-C-methyl-D-erythritol kinase [Desulfotomaculum arcticum]|uniref:4-diphosphocytidyl-2-C-methyl-D-erythritol kinase n=1 Tax=Desulfotruncus arcticus DSM 17038 TaxID=1121424 RepID=A0A1I2WGJ4_9FIRM|nr:4-(cytidine 5'-diphospho)-2-C-methyl-D-erythritol kinase [Desulfotruncus arcticus]SFG99446.1 4-diphosphocytidyl-2-C-methyl-D-erythritol kinase [Desulfotomaculum arcticum] [Desulfotruncus arcticus DSM 17038]
MQVKAYAKINLVLNITGVRVDGYHELETVMQTLALHDVLELSPANCIDLAVEGADLPSGPENLAYRAADLLRRETGCREGVRIRLIKKIPIAAGLAGGSADAAAVLRGLNRVWELGLTREELLKLAANIGSDVPFCISGGTALARGRGELIEPLPDLPPFGVLLVKPPFGVSTAEVYRSYDQTVDQIEPRCLKMVETIRQGDTDQIASLLDNDLEAVTTTMHPLIGAIKKDLLAAGARGVLMSGSGPTVFGIFHDCNTAAEAAGRLGRGNNWICATKFSSPTL